MLKPDTLAVMVAREAAASALVDKCPIEIVPAMRSEYYNNGQYASEGGFPVYYL